MAELVFFHGTMNCGKSTLALQTHHNQQQAGRSGLLLSLFDRNGAMISTRIGLEQPALVVEPELDLRRLVGEHRDRGEHVDYLICDEACFYTREQIDQLGSVVDDLGVEVYCYGLLVDFTSTLFPGSARLLEIADRCVPMQVRALCWCGAVGSQNARLVDGVLQREGETIVVGDIDDGDAQPRIEGVAVDVSYEVLCRRHYVAGRTRRDERHADGDVASGDGLASGAPVGAAPPSANGRVERTNGAAQTDGVRPAAGARTDA